jgi:hypothetical protein
LSRNHESFFLGVPTRGRPDGIVRLLKSVSSLGEPAPRAVVIADGSTSAEECARTGGREGLSASGDNTKIHYLDFERKAQLVSELGALSGIDRSLLGFAFIGFADMPTYGATQNTIHLFLKGERVVLTDDDYPVGGGVGCERTSLTPHDWHRMMADSIAIAKENRI